MSVTPFLPGWAGMITLLFGGGGLVAIGGILKTWLDHKRGARAQSDTVALDLVTKLEVRIDTLERNRDRDHAECEAKLGVQRHQIANGRTIIYSLLHIIEMPTAKQADAIKRVREDLARLEQAETTEKAIIAAAPLTGSNA